MRHCAVCGQDFPAMMDRCPQCDKADDFADVKAVQGAHPGVRILVWLVAISTLLGVFYVMHRLINTPRHDNGWDNLTHGFQHGLAPMNEDRLEGEGILACVGAIETSSIAKDCDTLEENTPMRGTALGCFCRIVSDGHARKKFCRDLVQPIHGVCVKLSNAYPDSQGPEHGYNQCVVPRVVRQMGPALDRYAKSCGVAIY